MILTLLILAIGGFLSPVFCKSSMNFHPNNDPKNYPDNGWNKNPRNWPFCVLEGVLKEEWDDFLKIIDCGPIESCEPTMLETLPTIGKYLG